MFSAQDHGHMAQALRLAARGLYTTRPNPRVGCVIVNGGCVVGEGFHAQAGGPHAESVALSRDGEAAQGATVYVTLEPCCHFGRTAPCVDALIAARVAHVIYAIEDPNPRVAGGGAARLNAAGITFERGLMGDAARELNRGFFTRHTHGRPWVCVKIALSLDGKTALANGRSQWITGMPARADVQRLRAEAGAIVTGSGTVLADDPQLTVRDPNYDVAGRPPGRIVIDTNLRTPPSARLFDAAGEVTIFTASTHAASHAALKARRASIEVIRSTATGIDLAAVFARLGALEINDVLVEAGATLVGSLLQHGLVDELVLYYAPLILGAGARSAFTWPVLETLDAAPRFQVIESRSIGADHRVILRASA